MGLVMIWPQCVLGTAWFQVSSRKCLVLRAIYPYPSIKTRISPYSHMNVQN